MADILLGSFRYCVNEPDKDIANAAIFSTLVRVMWYRESKDGTKNLREYGLTLRGKKRSSCSGDCGLEVVDESEIAAADASLFVTLER